MRSRELRRAPTLYSVSDVLFRTDDDSKYDEQHRGVVMAEAVDKIIVISHFSQTGITTNRVKHLIQP
jgi:hypothetical protein